MQDKNQHHQTKTYTFTLKDKEIEQFELAYLKSCAPSKGFFIRNKLLNNTLKSIIIDKVKLDYYMRLTSLYEQFYQVGLHYSTLIQQFPKQKQLEDQTILELINLTKELTHICKNIVGISLEFEAHFPSTSNYYDSQSLV
ncbi:plasmid mobilization protein [Myroides sp. LJL119]